MMVQPRKSYNIIFKGNVQGVGFRFTAQNIARNCGIKGWIRNNPNGSVEAVVQGKESDLRLFLTQIKSSFPYKISSISKQAEEPRQEFKHFRIKY
jgi:acylphosphatase